ncbi:HNH endonuclease [Tumebacillus sp. ITR2]|uniref:HNH endonuclease n=1 Tax=Tumebacillus amylolyticus TaxID=2801339 RepID=A0ABS1J6X8_9BACL|nr:HNH endonuclease signature motif containing protein [Tumebacillus amylolyticus]MBL0386037.1 HNH endonuclease [Tumebacillus amylolyticus]
MAERTSTRKQLREERAALMKRNDFNPTVRAHIRERDGERCVLCGRPGREVHHILPRAQGGLGTADNGICLDSSCHHQAHRQPPVEKQLHRFRERILLPYYSLSHPSQHVSVERIEELRALQEAGHLSLLPPRIPK